MQKIFIDTSVLIALSLSSEKDHTKSKHCYEQYKKSRAIFYTSTDVLDEYFTRLIYDCAPSVAKQLIDITLASIRARELRILEVDTGVLFKAIEVVKKYCEHQISCTDATTYILCRELAIDEIFTLDSDFKKLHMKTSFS